MKILHLPLPDEIYLELKAEAQRSSIPATSLALHAIRTWLRARKKILRRQGIAAYATQTAGTELDLDPALESDSLDFLLESES